MKKQSRRKSFARYQWIIDDLHSRVANGEFISDSRAAELYGKADYRALTHYLQQTDAYKNNNSMTAAMEWLYMTRHFEHTNSIERDARLSKIYMIISAVIMIFNLCLTAYTIYVHRI